MTGFLVTVVDADGQMRDQRVGRDDALIGRMRSSTIRLAGWRVGRAHARIVRMAQGLVIEDLGSFAGTWVNGTRVVRHGPLRYADAIQIGGYTLRVQDRPAPEGRPTVAAPGPRVVAASSRSVHTPATPAMAAPAHDLAAVQARHPWRKRVHDQLLDTIDLRRRDLVHMSDAELRAETDKLVHEIVDALAELPPDIDRAALRRDVLDEAIGLGPLEALLADDAVSEVMVNLSLIHI